MAKAHDVRSRNGNESSQSLSPQCIANALTGLCLPAVSTGCICAVLERGGTPSNGDLKMILIWLEPSQASRNGFSGVSLRRKRGKNGEIPSLSRSCKAFACESRGQSERPPEHKPTRIDMPAFDVRNFSYRAKTSGSFLSRHHFCLNHIKKQSFFKNSLTLFLFKK